jgi:hypothetical protein
MPARYALFTLVGIAGEDDSRCAGSLHSILRAVLGFACEQGSAKTVLSKLLNALIDPNVAPVRALIREERELMIAANNGHLLAFDNLSHLPIRLSDALCRLATGGSLAVRQLYANEDEVQVRPGGR